MRTFIATIPESDFQLFRRPGLDLVSGQIVELDTEPAPAQLDLFAEPRPLPLARVLQALGDRCAAAFRSSGDNQDRERGRMFHMVAAAVDELASGHPVFAKLDKARAFPDWTEIEREFVEGLGGHVDLSTASYPSLVFAAQLESLLDVFLAEHA